MSSDFLKVRAGFVRQGTSLRQWCLANGIKRQNARKALLGDWKGPRGLEVRELLLKASGVSSSHG
ncbi:MAG: hypothetical protein IAF00_03470 [Phycisphaerales bacterium]|nr:hypothetical protein [Phycisphaerales bacterium]